VTTVAAAKLCCELWEAILIFNNFVLQVMRGPIEFFKHFAKSFRIFRPKLQHLFENFFIIFLAQTRRQDLAGGGHKTGAT